MSTPVYAVPTLQAIESAWIRDLGDEGEDLMQQAAASVFRHLLAHYPDARHWGIACGAGNNGGDGYALARMALAHGLHITVLAQTLPKPDSLAGRMHAAYLQAGGAVQSPQEAWPSIDLWVDAVFGIGFRGDLPEVWQQVFQAWHASQTSIVAVDVPSGVHADTGMATREAVKAHHTVTMLAHKRGLWTGAAKNHTGDISLADLGFEARQRTHPEHATHPNQADGQLLRFSDIKSQWPMRLPDSHKNHFGHVLVAGGSRGMSGAVRLAGEAALRAGAGVAHVAVLDAEAVPVVMQGRPELMVSSPSTAEDWNARLKPASVCVLGCGVEPISQNNDWLSRMLAANMPTVLDAGALRWLADHPETALPDATVLTPHPGEAAALLGISIQDIQADRFAAIQKLVARFGCTVLLKGAGTLIQSPHQAVNVIAEGNPAMATAGMGDVLSGMIGACLAQGMEAHQAATFAACWHATAADQNVAAYGAVGLCASDIFEQLRSLMR